METRATVAMALLMVPVSLGMAMYEAFWLRLLWPYLPPAIPTPTWAQAVALSVVVSILVAQASPEKRDDRQSLYRFVTLGPFGYLLVRLVAALSA